MSNTIPPFKALALQTNTRAVNRLSIAEARDSIKRTIQEISSQIRASCQFIGQDCKLVVLPEYFLSGFPLQESVKEWQQKACINFDGEEYAALSKIAVDNNIFLNGNVYELDQHFPSLFFQSCFIIAPNGELILRYRRLNSMYTATPHDVLDQYVEIYGWDSLFPVAKTIIGNLACLASEEILYPEIARCMAFRGAEIFLHSTSEVGSLTPSPKNIAKQARALENMAYVISANSAGISGYDIPADSTNGHSQIVNFEGQIITEAGFGESMAANSTIHIDALRQHRSRPGMANYLSRMRNELFVSSYANAIYPGQSLLKKTPNREHFKQLQDEAIRRLRDKGIIP